MHNPLANITGRQLNLLITIASSCAFVLFGYDNALFSALIINPWFLDTFHHPKSSLIGTISATYNLGGFAGGIVAFCIGNKFGRRTTILTGIAITSIGAVPFATATSIAELLAGRLLTGVGVGIMSSTVGLWQAETVPAHRRGAFLVGQLLYGATLGLFLAQWINFGLYARQGRVTFVFPICFQYIFLLISAVLVILLPESPRWLVKEDRMGEALQVLTRLTGDDDARARLREIQDAASLENTSNQITILFSNGPTQNFRRLCLACGVMIFHQLVGVNSITAFLPTLLQKFLGTSRRDTLWIAGLSSVVSASATLIAIFTVDRIGRKPYLVWGSVAQAIFFMIIAILLGVSPPQDKTLGTAAVVMLFLWFWTNSCSWLGQSWAYPTEILPLRIREKGLALGNVCYWLSAFMMIEVTPVAIDKIYYKFYIILAVFNACIALVIWLCYPETARLSLEELDLMFAKGHGRGTPTTKGHARGEQAIEAGTTEVKAGF